MAVGGRCCWPSWAFPRCQGTAAGRPAGLLALSGVLAGEGMVPPLFGYSGAPGSLLPRLCPRLGSGGPELGLVGLSRAPPLGVGPQELGGLPSHVQCPPRSRTRVPLSSHQL